MTENEARYIVRMIQALRNNTLFLDATTADAEELDRMKERYQEAGRWDKGQETALIEFILRVERDGVPGGTYINPEDAIDMWLAQRDVPRIERP